MRWLVPLAAVLAIAACSSSANLPGQKVIGTYAFTAAPTGGDCSFIEQPDGGFTYNATLSFDPGTSHGYVTINGVSRDAGFDGQVMDAPASANRVFSECNCGNNVVVNERITVALLSASQRAAVGGSCPPNPLDGGVPAPNDAGIAAPSEVASGFDAPIACGVQTEDIVPGTGCSCAGCSLQYSVSGVRQ